MPYVPPPGPSSDVEPTIISIRSSDPPNPTFSTYLYSATPTSTSLPTSSKAGPNSRTDIIAGVFIGIVGVFILALWLHAIGIPWMREYPARVAARKAEQAERAAQEECRGRTRTRTRAAVPATNRPEDISRTWIPPFLGRNHVPTSEELARLPPTVRLVTSGSDNSLQAGIDAVRYDRELRLGQWGVDQELPGNPTYLRIPPRRSSLGAVERTVLMMSGEQFERVEGKGKGILTDA